MTEWISERLSEVHDLSQFDSSQAPLDDWLRDHAAHSRERPTDDRLLQLGHGAGSRRRAPAAGSARWPISGPRRAGGMLAWHGGELLWDAMSRAFAANALATARAIVVDALDERAASFYEHFGFIRVASVAQFPLRLAIKMSSVERNLGW